VNYLLKPFYFVYKLWIGLVFWVTLILLYPLFRFTLSSRRYYHLAFRLKRFWSLWLSIFLFCPVRKQYRAKLPPKPYIIVSNHSSHLDTVFMYRLFDDYFVFLGKGELLRWPLFRRFFRTMDIPVHRDSNRKSYVAMQLAADAIRRGECVAIYPEGTIPAHSPRMKSFKNGAFRLAADLGVPVVPVTWCTNYRILRDPEKLFEPSMPFLVRAIVHEPVFASGTTEEDVVNLRNRVFATIDSALPAKYRKPNYDRS
jgi:1-acyl-sn-glycerol-3-phosphate acyltransferase